MKLHSSLTFALLLLLSPGLILAQRPGGGGGGGGGQGQQGQRGSAGMGQGTGQGSGRGAGLGTMSQTRQMQRDRLHTQATTAQRDQYRACDQSLDQLRTRTRDMSRATTRSSFDLDGVRSQQAQVRDQFRTMEQNRTQLYGSLNQEQNDAVQARVRNLDRLRDRIQTRLTAMDQELAQSSPNREVLAKQARLTEKEMQNYRLHFQHMGDDLGLTED